MKKSNVLKAFPVMITCAILIFSAVGCAESPSSNSQNEELIEELIQESTAVNIRIDAATAKRMINEEDVIILDVRTPSEYAQGHIKDSVLVEVDLLTYQAQSLLPEKDQPILIYCRSGNRSAQAAALLEEMGYTNLYDFGGIISWPYEIVQP